MFLYEDSQQQESCAVIGSLIAGKHKIVKGTLRYLLIAWVHLTVCCRFQRWLTEGSLSITFSKDSQNSFANSSHHKRSSMYISRTLYSSRLNLILFWSFSSAFPKLALSLSLALKVLCVFIQDKVHCICRTQQSNSLQDISDLIEHFIPLSPRTADLSGFRLVVHLCF